VFDVATLHRLIVDQVPPNGEPGVAVAVVQHGHTLAAEGFGLRDVERRLPITADTLFPICSLSKSFTATAVLQLVERGLLVLDAPVTRYLPWFRTADAAASSQITLRMLLSHTSGMGRTGHQGAMWAIPVPYADRADLVHRLAEVELQSPPGSAWSYCNEGYVTLGLLVEQVSGLSLESYFERNIFAAVGMERSVARFSQWRAADDRAHGYDVGAAGYVPAEELPPDYGIYLPSGGVCSSARDMARYAAAALDAVNSPLLSAGGLAQMQTAAFSFGSTGWGYGCGWDVFWNEGRRVVCHSGGLPGFNTYLLLVPDARLGVVVLANGEGIFPIQIAERVAGAVLGQPVLARSADGDLIIPTRAAPAVELAPYEGVYDAGENGTLRVGRADTQRLLITYDPDVPFPPTPALPVGVDFFLEQRSAAPLQFIRQSDGSLGGLLRGGHLFKREG
jgi:CubicO group peptidase (beta-lactamase class C family)